MGKKKKNKNKRDKIHNSNIYGNFPKKNSDNKISRRLISILRHKALNMKINIDSNGFVEVDELLRKHEFRSLSHGDIKRIVENNDKKRFGLKYEHNKLLIRANQGHTMGSLNLDMEPVLSPEKYPNVIHGTYFSVWNSAIKTQGLSKMKRTHVHFAVGEPGESGVISGMRSSCQVMIYLNLALALKDGLKFYVSENNVILSKGDEHGFIRPKYFLKVIDRISRKSIDF
ncbi:tRNA 2'-phosphotransferase 1-like [Argonauta hians]